MHIVDHPTTEQNSRRFIKLSLHKLLSHRITLLVFFSNSAVVVFVIFTIGSTLEFGIYSVIQQIACTEHLNF